MHSMTSAALQVAKKDLEEFEIKLKQKREKIKRLEIAERAKQAKVDRARETRQKLLIGAFVLQKSGLSAEDFVKKNIDFDVYLTRDHDRAAFGLDSITPASENPE